MKHFVFIFTLFLILTGCSDNSLNTKSAYDQGITLAIEGKFQKAQKAFTKALQNETNNNAAQQSLEVVKRSLGERLDTAAGIDFFKGIRAGNKNELVLAFSYFSKAIKTSPNFATAYYERGIINGRLKLYDKAVEDFSISIKLNPQDETAYNNRGLARAKGLKKYNQAIEDFTKAVELNPKFAEAYDNRAIAHQVANDNKIKACADWKKACDLNRCNSYNRAKQNNYCQ